MATRAAIQKVLDRLDVGEKVDFLPYEGARKPISFFKDEDENGKEVFGILDLTGGRQYLKELTNSEMEVEWVDEDGKGWHSYHQIREFILK